MEHKEDLPLVRRLFMPHEDTALIIARFYAASSAYLLTKNAPIAEIPLIYLLHLKQHEDPHILLRGMEAEKRLYEIVRDMKRPDPSDTYGLVTLIYPRDAETGIREAIRIGYEAHHEGDLFLSYLHVIHAGKEGYGLSISRQDTFKPTPPDKPLRIANLYVGFFHTPRGEYDLTDNLDSIIQRGEEEILEALLQRMEKTHVGIPLLTETAHLEA